MRHEGYTHDKTCSICQDHFADAFFDKEGNGNGHMFHVCKRCAVKHLPRLIVDAYIELSRDGKVRSGGESVAAQVHKLLPLIETEVWKHACHLAAEDIKDRPELDVAGYCAADEAAMARTYR